MAVAEMSGTTLVTIAAVRLNCSNANGFPNQPQSTNPLSISKPTWIVQTQSNVRKMKRKVPDPPCVICKGSGRIDCRHCRGRGRKNFTDHLMLPKGEWPKWCLCCGGSGLDYCYRCLGTGEYRDVMGFNFMISDSDKCDHSYEGRRDAGRRSADNLFFSAETYPDKNS